METKSFAYGLVTASVISGILYFIFIFSPSDSTGWPVTTDVANAYFKKYYDNTPAMDETLKGFRIENEQFDVMLTLSANDLHHQIVGYRFYPGVDTVGAPVGLIVGVDAAGKDITSSIYCTQRGRMGPCPDVCDNTSAITQ